MDRCRQAQVPWDYPTAVWVVEWVPRLVAAAYGTGAADPLRPFVWTVPPDGAGARRLLEAWAKEVEKLIYATEKRSIRAGFDPAEWRPPAS